MIGLKRQSIKVGIQLEGGIAWLLLHTTSSNSESAKDMFNILLSILLYNDKYLINIGVYSDPTLTPTATPMISS